MLKLIKYELKKQKVSKLVMIGLFVVLEAVFAYGLITKSMDVTTGAAAGMMFASIFCLIYASIEAIITYDKDMKNKSGYMLFMVPHSEYAILGSKIITSIFTIIILAICLGALGFMDIMLMASRFSSISQAFDMVQYILKSVMNVSIDLPLVATYLAIMVIEWIGMLTSAFLAITIVHTVLGQVKFKGVLAFVFFIAINLVFAKLYDLVVPAMDYTNTTIINGNTVVSVSAMIGPLLVTLCCSAVFAAISFIISGYLLNKKLSL